MDTVGLDEEMIRKYVKSQENHEKREESKLKQVISPYSGYYKTPF